MGRSYTLKKHEVVMKRHERQESDRHVYFQFGDDGVEHREGYYLTRVNYEDMGAPDQITVTVVSGNALNAEKCLEEARTFYE